jgi:glycosyltransferase involved in cell wall biosynthesis
MMPNSRPKISILTAAYNGAAYLPRLAESIKNQSFTDYEHLIIDDGSTDNGATQNFVESLPKVRSWRKENSGQYDTQNHLLRAAHGDIITIINQDDAYIDDQVLQDVADRFAADDSPQVVYGDVEYMDEAGASLPYRYAFVGPRSEFLLRNVSCVYHIALFFKRELVEANDLFFDPSFKMAGDWEWNLRLFKAAQSIVHIGRPISLFRVHSGQKTMSVGERGFKPEVRRICKKHGISPLLNSMLRFYVNLKSKLTSYIRILRREGIKAFITRTMRSFRKG